MTALRSMCPFWKWQVHRCLQIGHGHSVFYTFWKWGELIFVWILVKFLKWGSKRQLGLLRICTSNSDSQAWHAERYRMNMAHDIPKQATLVSRAGRNGTRSLRWGELIPRSSFGCFDVAVLNALICSGSQWVIFTIRCYQTWLAGKWTREISDFPS